MAEGSAPTLAHNLSTTKLCDNNKLLCRINQPGDYQTVFRRVKLMILFCT